MALNVIFIVAC